ncbi:MAG: phosphatidylglycerophosphatase A [Nitrospirae bacterium]|nr:phosphatidylglycerophosphatase A [Nitrospirota bacterium]
MKTSRLFLKNIATLGFIGYLPYAPGTWGSLAGVLFVAALRPALHTELIIIAAGTILGVIASDAAEKVIGEADSGHIIIDEFVGMVISVTYLPPSAGYLIAAFLLFRLFDIVKPFPIGYVESSLKGGTGVMADDIVAGIFTNGVLQIWVAYSG